MLVLSRREKEEIFLILNKKTMLRVKVLKVQGGQVRLGFEAPKEISILRSELLGLHKKEAK